MAYSEQSVLLYRQCCKANLEERDQGRIVLTTKKENTEQYSTKTRTLTETTQEMAQH